MRRTIGRTVERSMGGTRHPETGSFVTSFDLRVEPYSGPEAVLFVNEAADDPLVRRIERGVRDFVDQAARLGRIICGVKVTLTALRDNRVYDKPRAFRRWGTSAMEKAFAEAGVVKISAGEWEACQDPMPMLEALRASDRLTERRARLFAVACCRRIWDLLTDERLRRAVEVAERYADGLAGKGEMEEAHDGAWEASHPVNDNDYFAYHAALDASDPCFSDVDAPYRFAAYYAAEAAPDLDAERAAQAALLRDIFGVSSSLPRPPAGEVIVRMARAIYEDRDLPAGHLDCGRMAVLADALEEAGRTDSNLLTHLRGPGPHVRGCDALDLILGQV